MASISRKDFIKKTALTVSALPLLSFPLSAWAMENSIEEHLSVNIFSKHLQFLDYTSTGGMAAEMGFSGVDLTVRPKGHVLPELVKVDLPKAVSEIKSAGSTCEMITTSIESVNNTLDVDIIKTAAKSGINYYRTHWFKYIEGKTM